jgi:succinate dehydrogenase / fumarate reductase cytochrome b subunit
LRRAHSLSGAIASGGFLLLHLWTQGRALSGWQAYNQAVSWGARSPLWIALEVSFIHVPLLYHAGYGLNAMVRKRSDSSPPGGLSRYPYRKAWVRALQHSTGLIALIFVAYNLWQFRWQLWLGNVTPEDLFPRLCAMLSSTTSWGAPVAAFSYLVGTSACIVHFCNGLSAFSFYWGLVRTRRAERAVAWACGLLGLLLFSFATATILYFATGSTPTDLMS